LEEMKVMHPAAKVLVHPESPKSVIEMADAVGSTTGIIQAAERFAAKGSREFIVATDGGIIHQMRKLSPHKRFIEAPTAGNGATCKSCAHCPWMAMNGLSNLARVLETGANEILIDRDAGRMALRGIQRMLDFAASRRAPPVARSTRDYNKVYAHGMGPA
jgi:quinolinate synthase